MKVERREDGTLVIGETLAFLRWGGLVCGLALAGTLAAAQFAWGGLDVRTWLGGGFTLALAFSAAAFVPDRTFEFEVAAGRLRWAVRRLAYRRGGSIPFADISAVVVQVDANREERRLTYRLVLMTRAGALPLSSVRTADRDACDHLADRIREALGRPRTASNDAATGMAEAGYVVDAIALLRRKRGLGLVEARDRVTAQRSPSVPGASAPRGERRVT